MREEAFIRKHSESWAKLEEYNQFLEKKPITKMSKEQIRDFTELFRETGFHLAYAQTHFKDSKATTYLNQLVSISHSYFYSRKQNAAGEVMHYFTQTFPQIFRANLKYFIISTSIFMLGAFLAAALVLVDEQYLYYFFPDASQIRIDGENLSWDYSLMSAVIMSNNILVSLKAFCYGITVGLGTLYILLYNGMFLGALSTYVMAQQMDALLYWSLILPHGILELCAIFISGAAGLILGKHLLIPGQHSRKDSLIMGARQAGLMIPGIVIMLVLAGLIEGFFTPQNVPIPVKLLFALLTGIALLVYFLHFSKKPN